MSDLQSKIKQAHEILTEQNRALKEENENLRGDNKAIRKMLEQDQAELGRLSLVILRLRENWESLKAEFLRERNLAPDDRKYSESPRAILELLEEIESVGVSDEE